VASSKDKLIAGAQKLVEKGQFAKAIKEYLKVVQQDDKDVRIWLKIGDLYAKLGKKPEAAETYAKVAQFYSDQGFYLKAVAVYKQILKLDPTHIDSSQKLAKMYEELALTSDALTTYEAVADAYMAQNQVPKAIETMGDIKFASIPFSYTKDRHLAKVPDDLILVTLERSSGAAKTDPPYQLGTEWKSVFPAGYVGPTHLVRPTLEANKRAHPETMAEVLRLGYGTQCTKHADGSLGNECKIH